MPAATVGLQAEDPTIAELLKPRATRPVSSARITWATATSICPTVHGFDEFFGNLYHLNAEEEPELPDWPSAKDFPHFKREVRSTRRPALPGDGQG